MKALILILTLILSMQTYAKETSGSGTSGCSKLVSEELKRLQELSGELEETTRNFDAITVVKSRFSSAEESELNEFQIAPLDTFSRQDMEAVHGDYHSLGYISEFDSAGNEYAVASGVKVGKSCILTSAHVFYGSTARKVTDRNLSGTNFVTAAKDKFQLDSVIAMMDQNWTDFTVDSVGDRDFAGHSDLTLVKTKQKSKYHKKIAIVDPKDISAKALGLETIDIDGRKFADGVHMTCQGAPLYKRAKFKI